jgi:prolyl oligopeptidase
MTSSLKTFACVGIVLVFAILLRCSSSTVAWEYPSLDAVPVIDTYFDKKVVDEHRFLEYLDSPKVKSWFKEQNRFYTDIINRISGKDSLVNEIRNLVQSSHIRASIPREGGGKLFIKRTDDAEDVQKLYYVDSSTNAEKELFSTRTWNTSDRRYSIDYYEPSWNGKYVVIGVSVNGSEMSTLYTIDVDAKKILPDSITGCYNANPNWLPDGSGFLYNKLKETSTTNGEEAIYEDSKIKLHLVRTKPKEDLEVFSRHINERLNLKQIDFPYLFTFPASDKVLAFVYRGSSIYGLLYIADLKDVLLNPRTAEWVMVGDEASKITGYALIHDYLFLLKFQNNSNGVIERLNLTDSEHKQVLVQDDSLILSEFIVNRKSIFVKYLHDGLYGLLEIDPTNLETKQLNLPVQGSVSLSTGGKNYLHSDQLYIGLEGWAQEWRIYKYDGDTFSLTGIRPAGRYGRPEYLVAKEMLVPSHDGVLVPLSIIHHKDLKLTRENPVILFGYGAYGTSLEPGFDVTQLAWFNRGGVYAMAHVRGGGEKGDAWYKGGFKETKANSWKDFIACAEYLISNQYTSKDRLAALGASAGGITVGRAITERPDIFKAAVIQVGALNALRAEKSANTLTVTEFGTTTDSIEFEYLYSMDVYHHITKGVQYPSVLLTCAMNDARVESWEPAKVAAKMQLYGTGNNIALLRISEQGHFSEKDFVDQTAEIYSFLLWQLGHPDFKYSTGQINGR